MADRIDRLFQQWPMPGNSSAGVFDHLYPQDRSMAEEMSRLFNGLEVSGPELPMRTVDPDGQTIDNDLALLNTACIIVEEVLEDFRNNGRDEEYCPELEEHAYQVMVGSLHGQTSTPKSYGGGKLWGSGLLEDLMDSVLENTSPTPQEMSGWRGFSPETNWWAQRNGKDNRASRWRGMRRKCCVFCKNNGEEEKIYGSHNLKDHEGKITCPKLYKYTCPLCSATKEEAHTVKYCPRNPNGYTYNDGCPPATPQRIQGASGHERMPPRFGKGRDRRNSDAPREVTYMKGYHRGRSTGDSSTDSTDSRKSAGRGK